MDKLFKSVVEKCKMAGFAEGVRKKAHYGEDDLELLCEILEKIFECMECAATWSAKDTDAGLQQEVIMTLGAGVDELQETFLAKGEITEAYMVEVLASEILLLAYAEYNQWIKDHTDKTVARYYFLGADSEHLLEDLPSILTRSGLPVTCTEGYCMLPKKTVAFYAQLTTDHSAVCKGICMGCNRTDCPNRMTTASANTGNRTLDRPLTYGYAKIFGL
ncbi:MAG: hypothetical protein II477_11850 [Lachnospiraceae bacterium]|nr:hypothetical protein [Lachnospiraceae bacterium]